MTIQCFAANNLFGFSPIHEIFCHNIIVVSFRRIRGGLFVRLSIRESVR